MLVTLQTYELQSKLLKEGSYRGVYRAIQAEN